MEGSAGSKYADTDVQDPPELIDLVRSVWRDTFESDPGDDDTGFFEAGGDSFLLFVLIRNLSEASGLAVKTIDIVRADSIRGQAALLARAMREKGEEPVSGA
jgi:hypothetical protein